MKHWVVKITEALSRTVIIEANSPEEAEEKVEQIYDEEKLVLDYRDYDGYDINTVRFATEDDFKIYDDMDVAMEGIE